MMDLLEIMTPVTMLYEACSCFDELFYPRSCDTHRDANDSKRSIDKFKGFSRTQPGDAESRQGTVYEPVQTWCRHR